ncbi:MAG: PAS domain S-box protein [Syntrophomonas sp.]
MEHPFNSAVDTQLIQGLLERFSKLLGVGVSVLAPDSRILVQAGWEIFCSKFHSQHLACAELCQYNNDDLIHKCIQASSLCLNTCNSGWSHAAIPVIVEEKIAAILFIGQFFLHPSCQKTFADQARKYGLDESEYIQAVNQTPVINRERLDLIIDTLQFLLVSLVEMGISKSNQTQHLQSQFLKSEEYQAEQALKESKTIYRELFDNAAIILFTIDLAGYFTSINKYGLAHFGYEPEETIGITVFDIIVPEYHELVRSKINEKLNGTDITAYNIEIINGQGEKRDVELHTRVIYAGEIPTGIQVAGRDITDQKQVLQALEASEQKFRILAEESSAIIYILKGNRFVYVNPALIKLTAYSEEELLSMNFWEVVHPDHRELSKRRELARQKGSNVRSSYEVKLLNKNGINVWIYLTGVPITYYGEPAVIASAIDITEFKRGEEDLKESRMLLNHIIDFLPDATIVIDSEGHTLAWNRAMEKLTGLPASEVLGKGDYIYTLPFHGERRPMLIDLVLNPDENVKQLYYYIDQSDNNLTGEIFVPGSSTEGSYLWGMATPLYNANGEVTGAIESIRDITSRKNMEFELINQTNSLKILLESSPTGTAIIDNKENFVFLNSRFSEITGYSIEDIPNIDVWIQKTNPSTDISKSMLKDWNQQLKLKQRAEGIFLVQCKDGQIRNIEFNGIKLPDQRIIVSIWDMTWQKQVEESLRVGEARFKALSDASFEGIMLTDNGVCIEANQKAADMFGYEHHEMIGMTAVDFTIPESRTIMQYNIISGYELPYEIIALRKNGSTLPVEIQGRTFEYQGRRIRAAAVRDSSERHQAEAELARQRQNLQALFFNSPDAVALCNHERVIVDINPQFYNLFGYTLEECRNKHLNELIVPPQFEMEYAEHRRSILNNQSFETETVRKNKNGDLIDVMIKVVLITDYGFYVMYSDISTRKQTELIINEQVKELEAKNAEMERFTYTVSHDLRSPIITIKGFAGLLLEDIKQGNYSRLDNDLQRIINAAGKMDDLLSDLLELSRIGRMLNTFSKFSMTRLAQEAAELLTGRLKEVELIISPDMPTVTADQARIREVLQNLIENAIKFMGEQTRPRIEVGSLETPKEWIFFVRDNGVGIEPRYHESIFGLFNKLNSKSEGTGIGLSLVKRIVEFHQGRIWVDSAGIGQGSTFNFSLPRNPKPYDRRI